MSNPPDFWRYEASVKIPNIIDAPCGAKARWDYKTSCGYRCLTCFAILGSVGMPQECTALMNVGDDNATRSV